MNATSRAGLGFDSKYKLGAIVNLYITLIYIELLGINSSRSGRKDEIFQTLTLQRVNVLQLQPWILYIFFLHCTIHLFSNR